MKSVSKNHSTIGKMRKLLSGLLTVTLLCTAQPTAILSADARGAADFPSDQAQALCNFTSDSCFSISSGVIPYGTENRSDAPALQHAFSPTITQNGIAQAIDTAPAAPTVLYKFFLTDPQLADYAEFLRADGEELSTLPAGTKGIVVAAAMSAATYTDSTSDAVDTEPMLAQADFTIAKRKVSVRCTLPSDQVLDGRALPADGHLSLPAAQLSGAALQVFDADTGIGISDAALTKFADPAEFLEGDVTFDVSGIDITADGYQTAPLALTLAPSYDDNYELVGNIFGDIYVKKAQYYATFTMNNNGRQWTESFPLTPDTTQPLNAYDFYEKLQLDCDNFLRSFGGDIALLGWSVYTDGYNVSPEDDGYERPDYYNTTFVNPDAVTYERSGETKEFALSGSRDYHFVAQVSMAIAQNLYVTSIPSVYYDGREHVVLGSQLKSKQKTADLRVSVYCGTSADGGGTELVLDKDYTVSYENNQNASMRLVSDASKTSGTYEKSWQVETERPRITITGKGNYKGFSADVYFDILPSNLGAVETYESGITNRNSGSNDASAYTAPYTRTTASKARVSGFENFYTLKSGALTKRITPHVTKAFESSSYDRSGKLLSKSSVTYQLVYEKDYTAELYLWDDVHEYWEKQTFSDPNRIAVKGDYLYVVRGIGNYCGAAYDDNSTWADAESTRYNSFDDGKQSHTPNPLHSIYASQQFCVTENAVYDFSSAKIKIGVKSLPYKASGTAYGATNFKITAKNDLGKTLTLGKDYTVYFQECYSHHQAEAGITYGTTVKAANLYRVIVSPKGSYLGDSREVGKVTITGMTLKKSYFALSKVSVNFGATTSWELSTAGKKAGLSTDPASPYYVSGTVDFTGYNVASSDKVNIHLGGAGQCGYAIDPSAGVKLTYRHNKMNLEQALDETTGYLSFSLPATAPYNIKGAIPGAITLTKANGFVQTITPTGNKSTFTTAVYDKAGGFLGYETLQFICSQNKSVGGTAKVVVKGSGLFRGSAVLGYYRVVPLIAEQITVLTPNLTSYTNNALYVSFSDSPYEAKSKGKLHAKLYQAYYTTSGTLQLAGLKASAYKIQKSTDDSEHGCVVRIQSGSARSISFGADGTGTEVMYYGYYDQEKLPKIQSVTIDGRQYIVTNRRIVGLDLPFTGTTQRPIITAVTLSDKQHTVLNSEDFYLTYGTNLASKYQGGTVTLTTHYNAVDKRYPYHGTVTLKFNITDSKKISL
ncbi:MAG: hypothetical protein IJ747_02405 [Lachnospiraceae bacterium]|nr:hypothetical protein [Lachnospiraceae bacterium]